MVTARKKDLFTSGHFGVLWTSYDYITMYYLLFGNTTQQPLLQPPPPRPSFYRMPTACMDIIGALGRFQKG